MNGIEQIVKANARPDHKVLEARLQGKHVLVQWRDGSIEDYSVHNSRFMACWARRRAATVEALLSGLTFSIMGPMH